MHILESTSCKRDKAQVPQTLCIKPEGFKGKVKDSLNFEQTHEGHFSSNSASMQSLENKVLAFPIFGKQAEKPIQKPSNAFFQSTPAYPQVGATDLS